MAHPAAEIFGDAQSAEPASSKWRILMKSTRQRGAYLGITLLLMACGESSTSPATRAGETVTASGGVKSYGTMHAVMTAGAESAQARVALDDVLAQPGAIAVGAAVGLEGEITVYDGRAMLSRTSGAAFETTDGAGEGAAWLTVANVSEWTEVPVDADLGQAAFEAFVAEAAAAAGVSVATPFPIALRGELFDLRLHVLHGACPMRPGARLTEAQAPYVFEPTDGVTATLVGFRADDSVGQLTHPGTTLHLHAIVDVDGTQLTGHVERFAVRPGATLRLPQAF